jgi:hypothetical protein
MTSEIPGPPEIRRSSYFLRQFLSFSVKGFAYFQSYAQLSMWINGKSDLAVNLLSS